MSKTKLRGVRFPQDVADLVDKHQEKSQQKNFSQALFDLVRKGYKAATK